MLNGLGDVENSFPVVWVEEDARDFDGFAVGSQSEGAFGGCGGVDFAIKGENDFVGIDLCGVDVEGISGAPGAVLDVEFGEGGKIVAGEILDDVVVLVAVQIAVGERKERTAIEWCGECEVELSGECIDGGSGDGNGFAVFFECPGAVGREAEIERF